MVLIKRFAICFVLIMAVSCRKEFLDDPLGGARKSFTALYGERFIREEVFIFGTMNQKKQALTQLVNENPAPYQLIVADKTAETILLIIAPYKPVRSGQAALLLYNKEMDLRQLYLVEIPETYISTEERAFLLTDTSVLIINMDTKELITFGRSAYRDVTSAILQNNIIYYLSKRENDTLFAINLETEKESSYKLPFDYKSNQLALYDDKLFLEASRQKSEKQTFIFKDDNFISYEDEEQIDFKQSHTIKTDMPFEAISLLLHQQNLSVDDDERNNFPEQ